MENRNTKVVTFQNHYGAMLLKKKTGDSCTLRAVPRSLSSSCGTCVYAEDCDIETILNNADKELLEGIYQITEKGFEKIYE